MCDSGVMMRAKRGMPRENTVSSWDMGTEFVVDDGAARMRFARAYSMRRGARGLRNK